MNKRGFCRCNFPLSLFTKINVGGLPIFYLACPSHSARRRLSVRASLARGKAHGLCDTVAGPHSARPKPVFSPLNPVLTRRNDPRSQNSQNPPNFWFYFTFSDGCPLLQICNFVSFSVYSCSAVSTLSSGAWGKYRSKIFGNQIGATSWYTEVISVCLDLNRYVATVGTENNKTKTQIKKIKKRIAYTNRLRWRRTQLNEGDRS